jgi:hypothetical protein
MITLSHKRPVTAIRCGLITIVVVAAAAIANAQAQDSQTGSGARAISGRVVTRDGEPLSNARVTVTRYGVAGSGQTVRTNAGGSFETEPLDPGLYGVFAYAPGYVTYLSAATVTPSYYRPGDNSTITLIKGGVITGTVKNSNGDPLIAIQVRAIRVRDAEGKPVLFPTSLRERVTDDRGVYRLYALVPGAYVVAAGGSPRFGSNPPTPFEADAPIYAPSSTRDAAVEVAINNGDEMTVDIQYRSEPGHIVSGLVTGAAKPSGTSSYAASVSLFERRTRAETGGGAISNDNFAFSINGVPDGEYEMYASQGSLSGETLMSPPIQVKVQGTDVTGISLAVAPPGSIDGRVILESDPKAACGKRRSSALLETMIFARRHETEDKTAVRQAKETQASEVPSRLRNSVTQSTLDSRGSFTLKNLVPGTFLIDVREPASGWFARSIAFDRPIRNLNIPRDGLTLKAGERTTGLLVTIAEGAAKLQGRISVREGQPLPITLRVYLTPSERENADNVLRFYEARPELNGNFSVDNIAPGKYWIVARRFEENESGVIKSIRRDKTFRSTVQREAEALKKTFTLKPCEQLADYDLPFGLEPTSQP